MFTISELLSPDALAYTLPALGVFLFSLFVLFRHRGGSPDPTCGKCGYGVRGLPTLRCPECGSDLHEVGIRPAAPRLPLLLWQRTIALTFALGLPAYALLSPGLSLAPSYWTGQARTGLHRPASGRFYAIFLNGEFSGWGWSVPDVPDRGEIDLLFTNRADVSLVYDRPRGFCRWTKAGETVVRNQTLSPEIVAEWMRDAGLPADAETEAEAAEIYAETDSLFPDRAAVQREGPFGERDPRPRRWTRLHPPKWAWPLYAAPWIAAWFFFWSRMVRAGRAVRVRRPAVLGPPRELHLPADEPAGSDAAEPELPGPESEALELLEPEQQPPDEPGPEERLEPAGAGAALPDSGAPYDHTVAEQSQPSPEVILDDRRPRD